MRIEMWKTASLCLFLVLTLAGCNNDMDKIRMFDRQNPADQEIVDARVRRSESAQLKLELDAPLIRRYSKPTAKTLYPKGVEVRFYDSNRQIKTKLSAKYAISLDDKKQMEARDSVVVIDFSNGDTVYLENIIWDENEDRIYSNHPIRAVNGQRVTYGDGFASDSRMENLRILRQRGTIEFQD